MAVSRRVELVIETLVLEGVRPAARDTIAAAAAAELMRLLGRDAPVAGDAPRLRAPIARLASSDPRATGTAIARALHAALTAPRPTGGAG